MHQTERRMTRANPFATALVVGSGWGLALGFVDGLPVLLEIPLLPHLRVRLQTLTVLMIWYGVTGIVILGSLGLITWGVLRLLRREAGRCTLVALYSGVSIGLAFLFSGMYRLKIPFISLSDLRLIGITCVLVGLGGAVGVLVGLGVHSGSGWWQNGRGFLRPLRWRVVGNSLLVFFLTSVLALSAVVVYRRYLHDLAIFQPTPSEHVATPEQPNVVLITIDTLRADHLGVYGYDPEISPNIDGLARRGVVFDQAISQAPWTSPSVSSFITSLHPTEVGVCRQGIVAADQHVDRMRVTLAEVFQEAGYRTQAYADNPIIAPENRYDQGFDGFVGPRPTFSFDLSALHSRTLIGLLCQVPAICEVFDWGHSQLFDPVLGWDSDSLITDYGVRFLRLHKDERFFLWLYYVGPHAYYNPPKPFRPLPSEITPEREWYLRITANELRLGKELFRQVDRQAMISLYDGEIAYTDALVGEVLGELDRLGLTDRTVVVLNADHGEEFADHEGYGHGHTLYDELVRIPFIVSGPGIEAAGQRVETQVRLLDLVPTVCEIAGAPVPEEARGRSLLPLLRGNEMDELPAFSEAMLWTPFQKKAIRHHGYKLIYDVERETVELYNVSADPHEQLNLAGQEPEIVETMLADLRTWMAQNARAAAELPREFPLHGQVDQDMLQQLRDAGY
jgi:arylsulfatase A-like enzyme